MTRAAWLKDLRARGVTVYLSGSQLRVRGTLSSEDRARLASDHRGVVALLRGRVKRRQVKAEARQARPEPESQRRVVGQRSERLADGRLSWVPVFEDETVARVPTVGGLSDLLGRLDRVLAEMERPVSAWASRPPASGARWPRRPARFRS